MDKEGIIILLIVGFFIAFIFAAGYFANRRDGEITAVQNPKLPYRLFLDDVRNPIQCASYVHRFGYRGDMYKDGKSWMVVRNYKEFISVIKLRGLPTLVSFDHDLAKEHYDDSMYDAPEEYTKLYEKFEEKTGYDCAKWLIAYCQSHKLKLPQYAVHSMNPVGRGNIEKLFENYKKHEENKV